MIELELGEESRASVSLVGVAGRAQFLEASLALLVRDLTFAEFCSQLLHTLVLAMPCEAASLLEVDWARQCFFFRASSGASPDRIGHFEFPLNQGIAGHVLESRQPTFLSNVDDDASHLRSIAKTVGFEARNIAAVPILIRGKPFGVLEFLNRKGEADFLPTDREFIQTLVIDLARAVEVRLMMGWALQDQASRTSSATSVSQFSDQEKAS